MTSSPARATRSCRPPTSVATTGVPAAMASCTTSARASHSLGRTNTSAARNHWPASLRAQAHALRVPVHFVGARSDAGQWLRAAEVFVLPSEWEARALVVQEAMAAGTPVVATDVGGLHDLVARADRSSYRVIQMRSRRGPTGF